MLMQAAEIVGEDLIDGGHALRALPTITMYDYLATEVCCSVFHSVNSRLIRVCLMSFVSLCH